MFSSAFASHLMIFSAMAERDRLMVRGGNEKQGAMGFFKKSALPGSKVRSLRPRP
jgi:hypothetical protein